MNKLLCRRRMKRHFRKMLLKGGADKKYAHSFDTIRSITNEIERLRYSTESIYWSINVDKLVSVCYKLNR